MVIGAPSAAATATFPGRIEASDRVDLAFRIEGRLAERLVDVGSAVEAGSPVARLEPQNEANAVRAAEASLVAADAAFVRADNAYGRHRELLARGVTAQADFEGFRQARIAADAEVTAARAALEIAASGSASPRSTPTRRASSPPSARSRGRWCGPAR